MPEQKPRRRASRLPALGAAGAVATVLFASVALAGFLGLKPIARVDLLDPRRAALPDVEIVSELGLAMTMYRASLTRKAEAYPSDAPFLPSGTRWRWRAEGHGTIRRIAEGRFVLTNGDCLGSFCVDVQCEAAGWPKFTCSDGRPREMAAPDLSTVVFDGVTYTRNLPPLLEPVPDPVIPE